ncbi:MAG: hypothetical protein DI570_20610 [Phenylobacterium zucineum]|nr:MAG: hypothetical protein DI570_20610 [Phenylobacterium zucineum]
MKYAMTALAVVFLAGAGTALAQDRGDRPGRQERLEQRDRPQRDGPQRGGPQRDGGERPQRDWSRGEAPVAREAPRPPEAAAPRPAAEPRQVDRPAYRGTGGQPQDAGRRGDGRRGDDARGDGRRYEGRRDDGRRDGDRRDWDGRRDDRNDRRDWDRRGDERRDWDRRDRDRRDWDRRDDRRDYRRWERGHYPQVYVNPHRYRYDWRPPSGFYLRSWGYGEFFPRGWFGPGWWIVDAWQYDLPLPPPGFEWVRSGPDALLIDEYSGRIVQVVRNVFWY